MQVRVLLAVLMTKEELDSLIEEKKAFDDRFSVIKSRAEKVHYWASIDQRHGKDGSFSSIDEDRFTIEVWCCGGVDWCSYPNELLLIEDEEELRERLRNDKLRSWYT